MEFLPCEKDLLVHYRAVHIGLLSPSFGMPGDNSGESMNKIPLIIPLIIPLASTIGRIEIGLRRPYDLICSRAR